MKTIKIWNDDASERQLDQICNWLEDGEIMITPTDTLYGIACDALNPKAIDKICRLKGINPDKTNLSIICSNISMAAEYARFNNQAFQLLRDNTPGPVTFLFKSAPTLPKAFKGRKTVGVRIPDNKLCVDIVERLGHPLLTTSIEYADEDYARNPELIAEAYEGKVDFILSGDDGDTEPSTIVDCTGNEPEIVRQGKGILPE
ncbi:MAG: threonylcarbamoyl-AMP synthase [Bacteroides sp.]|nr:threonylcarbamoyl-AMP synthase [Bacteroides sp.]